MQKYKTVKPLVSFFNFRFLFRLRCVTSQFGVPTWFSIFPQEHSRRRMNVGNFILFPSFGIFWTRRGWQQQAFKNEHCIINHSKLNLLAKLKKNERFGGGTRP
jgi:hypothetical protein